MVRDVDYFMLFIQWLTKNLGYISALLVVIATIIEKSDFISAKPWSWLMKNIGNSLGLSEIRNSQSELSKKVENLEVSVLALTETRDYNIRSFNNTTRKIETEVSNLRKDILQVKTDQDINETDRIRSEMFKFGRIARQGGLITTEEWRHIQDMYKKYHEVLKANGQITEEYKLIQEKYNNQFKNEKNNIKEDL